MTRSESRSQEPGKLNKKPIMETLCLRNEEKRYIVSFRNRILILTHDYRVALRYKNFVENAKRVLGDIK